MSDRNFEHLYPEFASKVRVILLELGVYSLKHMPGYEWKMTDGFRTVAEQQMLYKKVPKVTSRDGVRRKSTHQYGLAADIAPFKDGRVDYSVSKDHWAYLAHLARKHGLNSGQDWDKKDVPHIEWPPEDTSTYRKAWRRVQDGFS